jgi:signal transduction histidine kinase
VMALRRTPIDVLDLCVQALGAVDLGERTVSLDVPEGLEVEADERRLLRVLTNLLSNVARYTPAAVAVTLRAAREGDAVALTVADRGPGVPEADLARLFDPFFRAEGSRSRATGGLGLGLMLVRQIAEAHGGSVSAESREGGGLSVTVRVPARVAVAANEG